MLIQRRMETFAPLPNMVKTGNGEIDFLKGIIDIFTEIRETNKIIKPNQNGHTR